MSENCGLLQQDFVPPAGPARCQAARKQLHACGCAGKERSQHRTQTRFLAVKAAGYTEDASVARGGLHTSGHLATAGQEENFVWFAVQRLKVRHRVPFAGDLDPMPLALQVHTPGRKQPFLLGKRVSALCSKRDVRTCA